MLLILEYQVALAAQLYLISQSIYRSIYYGRHSLYESFLVDRTGIETGWFMFDSCPP